MAANPLEELFKARKESNDKRIKELEAYKEWIKESLDIMNPLCDSIHSITIEATKYANEELSRSKLHILFRDKITETDDLRLYKGIIFVVATNRDLRVPTLRNFSNYPTLIFESDLNSRNTRILFSRGGRENIIREYNLIDIDLKNMVYTELAGFLANNHIN